MDPDAPSARSEPLSEPRNATKATVRLVPRDGTQAVEKSIGHLSWAARTFVAGPLLRREARALAALAGLPGVPRLLASTPTSLVMERMPGDTLFARRKKGMSPETAADLERLLAALHARGFAHGDIGRRDVLVAADGTVRLVDFATAVGPGLPPFLWRLLLPLWRRRDRSRSGKLIRRYRRRWDKRQAARAAKR
jgi:predicted Ser/Thr protein kinase